MKKTRFNVPKKRSLPQLLIPLPTGDMTGVAYAVVRTGTDSDSYRFARETLG